MSGLSGSLGALVSSLNRTRSQGTGGAGGSTNDGSSSSGAGKHPLGPKVVSAVRRELRSLLQLKYPHVDNVLMLVKLAEALKAHAEDVVAEISRVMRKAEHEDEQLCGWLILDAIVRTIGQPYTSLVGNRLPKLAQKCLTINRDNMEVFSLLFQTWADEKVFTRVTFAAFEAAIIARREAADQAGNELIPSQIASAGFPGFSGMPAPAPVRDPTPSSMVQPIGPPPLRPSEEAGTGLVVMSPNSAHYGALAELYAPTHFYCGRTGQRFREQQKYTRHQNHEARISQLITAGIPCVRKWFIAAELWKGTHDLTYAYTTVEPMSESYADPAHLAAAAVSGGASGVAGDGVSAGSGAAAAPSEPRYLKLAITDLDEYLCEVCNEILNKTITPSDEWVLQDAILVRGASRDYPRIGAVHEKCHPLWEKNNKARTGSY